MERLDQIASEVREEWRLYEAGARVIDAQIANRRRRRETLRELLLEAQERCKFRRPGGFDGWIETANLGIGRAQVYRLMSGQSSGKTESVSPAQNGRHFQNPWPVELGKFASMDRQLRRLTCDQFAALQQWLVKQDAIARAAEDAAHHKQAYREEKETSRNSRGDEGVPQVLGSAHDPATSRSIDQ
jgi:hypothetical protein